MKRSILLAGIVLSAGLAVSACSGSPSNTVATLSVRAAVTTTTPTNAAALTSPQSATQANGACRAEHLVGTVGQTQGSAGHQLVQLVLTNTDASTCTLRGYPGVSFVGYDQTQIGAAATRQSGAPITTASLPPGGSAHADLLIAQTGNYDNETCHPTSVEGFRVYPPNDFDALFIADSQPTGCLSDQVTLLSVGPMTR